MLNNGFDLDQSTFLTKELNSHTFFEDLPSDGFHISGVTIDKITCEGKITELLNSDFDAIQEHTLNELLIGLANNFSVMRPSDRLHRLANHLSLSYARLLKGKQKRSLRMKLQKCNFYLRDLLDRDRVPEFLGEKHLGVTSPWDWLVIPQGEILITSDDENVHVNQAGKTYKTKCGLPSQVDLLGDGRISIGSIFSNGGYLLEEGRFQFVEHNAPIVLFFLLKKDLCFLDYHGGIFSEHDRKKLIALDLFEVSRVRQLQDQLYMFDWTEPHAVLVFNLKTQCQRKIFLENILLGNDICEADRCMYLLDKQQGYVFKFDFNFTLSERRLSFGKAPGRLYDPIAVRVYDGKLHILNWISHKFVYVNAF